MLLSLYSAGGIIVRIEFNREVSEKTNRGVLSKAWYVINGEDYLIKGNTPGTLGSLGKVGYEPYSEVMASRIASLLGFPHIEYTLADASLFPQVKTYRIRHVSVCKNFLHDGSITYPLRRYLMMNGVKRRSEVWEYLIESGLDLRPLYLVLVFDALTGNEDRHLNNIDVIIDSSGRVSFAPIYDNGASLLSWRYVHQLTLAGVPYALDKARPFDNTHRQQIKRVPKGIIPKADLSKLLRDILESIEPVMIYLTPARRNAIRKFLSWRIRYLAEVMG